MSSLGSINAAQNAAGMTQPLRGITVAVCTYKRPNQLKACLESLAAQTNVFGYHMEVVVIDNDAAGSARESFDSVSSKSPYWMEYLIEPSRGIANARNAAIEYALDTNAKWLVFIDDDQTADKDWLANLMHPDYIKTPILWGVNIYEHPKEAYWAKPGKISGQEGQSCRAASTGNVRMSIDVVSGGLRFDPDLNFSGGEDAEFFAAAYARGYKIKRTLRAITREKWPLNRLTYRAITYRAYWCAASDIRRLALTRGWPEAFLRKAHTIPAIAIIGAMWLLASLASYPFSEAAFKKAAMTGGKKLAKSAGRLTAFLRIKPQPYA